MNALGGLGVSISYFALAYLGAIILFTGVSFILSALADQGEGAAFKQDIKTKARV